ncbi:MAG: hypothetical protein QOH37_607 [Nocardioidaceae bacterium]|jgi:hypothetical protein|nr:hypothetical protein [Nocardioidaceae bacterium]
MGASYDYFRAAGDQSARQAADPPGGPSATAASGLVETTWVEPTVRVGKLFARVTDRDWTPRAVALIQVSPDEPIGPDNWETPTVHRFDDVVRDALADVPLSDQDALGRWWAQTEEFVLDRAEPEQVRRLCVALLDLCRKAARHDESVYVWSSL